jgi:hypothetical protein
LDIEEVTVEDQNLALLETVLESQYLPHLPPLLDTRKSAGDQRTKNLSRAFSAFALRALCDITAQKAAQAVVDDYDDKGLDVVYYHGATETLYLVQGKFKKSETFGQDEALAFSQGVRKIIKEDFDGFNQNVLNRRVAIEDAVANCSEIKLVIAHIGSGVSQHAKDVMAELLADEADEERLCNPWIDFDTARVMAAIHASQATKKIDGDLGLLKCQKVETPRLTYFGLIEIGSLVALHESHGAVLYERNIRSFLGKKTPVNAAIRDTLATSPESFVYLNNGVTMLADTIDAKNNPRGERRRLKLRGLSVINGAQTIASSAQFHRENPQSDISDARVLLTIIKADSNGEFGKQVTRARNHQNPVESWNFAALDDEQERLRCELAHFNLHYVYKAAAFEGSLDPSRIHIAEAAQALALLHPDPRFTVWLKKEPSSLLETSKYQYKALFVPGLTGLRLANAVKVNRFIQSRMNDESARSRNFERLVYTHGNYAAAWILSKRLRKAIDSKALLDDARINTELSRPFDELRQTLQDETRKQYRGPLAVFRNQGEALPVLVEVAIHHYGLVADPAIAHKKTQQRAGQLYAVDLFEYLVSKAPQIEVQA